MAWQHTWIDIPPGYSPEDRKRIGDDILDFIKDRCAEGVGIRESGRLYDFPEYTPEYRKFKGSSRVDLVLNDEMLQAMEVLGVKTDRIHIGFRNGSRENAKAEGNQIGSYGRSPNPRKARRFLGLTKGELEAILAPYERKQTTTEK